MKHCKDCKWWKRYSTPTGCHKGRCAFHSDDENSLLSVPGDQYGEIETMPDFGCIQFEPKESEPHERQR